MPLTPAEKEELRSVLEKSFSRYSLKKAFLEAQILMSGQSETAKKAIAEFYSSRIIRFMQCQMVLSHRYSETICRPEFENIKNFLAKSIFLSGKNPLDFEKVLFSTRIGPVERSKFALWMYDCDAAVTSISSLRIVDKRIIDKNRERLVSSAKRKQPGINESFNFSYTDALRCTTVFSAALFLINEDKSAVIGQSVAIGIIFFMAFFFYHSRALNRLAKTLDSSLKFNFDADNEEQTLRLDFVVKEPIETELTPHMSMVLRGPSEDDAREFQKKVKNKRHAATASVLSEPEISVALEPKLELLPSYFGDDFRSLPDNCLVKLEGWGLGERSNLYGIFDANKMTRYANEQEYARLFTIFREGHLVGPVSENGIKYIPELKAFEIKAPSFATRIIGREMLRVDGNTAILFELYEENGLHNSNKISSMLQFFKHRPALVSSNEQATQPIATSSSVALQPG